MELRDGDNNLIDLKQQIPISGIESQYLLLVPINSEFGEDTTVNATGSRDMEDPHHSQDVVTVYVDSKPILARSNISTKRLLSFVCKVRASW